MDTFQHIKYVLILIYLVILNLSTYGQPINLSFEHLNAKDGLEGGYNDFIYKDSRNFVWISSAVGLHRYDGDKIKLYSSTNEYGAGMIGKSIQSRLIEDSKGNIWFSTLEGIHCYLWKEDIFEAFQLKDESGEIIDKDYNSFHLEQDSILWTLADEIIYKYNIKTGQQVKVIDTKGVRFSVDTTNSGTVKTIYACPWVKQSGFEVININIEGSADKIIYFENGLSKFDESQVEISGSLVQNTDITWLFSDKGLIKFEHQTPEKYKRFYLPESKVNSIKDGAILNEQYLLLASENSGLWVFDTQLDSFIHNFSYREDDSDGLTTNNIREVYLDNENHLWLASKSSAEIDHSWIYNNIFENPLENFSSTINSIVEDKKNQIWCSSLNSGVFVINDEGAIIQHFVYDLNNAFTGKNLPPIQHLRIDKIGRVWALSKQFLFYYDINSKKWVKTYDAKDNRINDFYFLSTSEGIIANSKGLFRFTLERGSNIDSLKNKVEPNEVKDFQVYNLFQVKSDLIYLPVKSSELWIYQPKINKTYILELETEVHSIWEDTLNATTWIGTLDGLYSLDINTMQWELHKVDNGLKEPQILGVIGGGSEKLWLSTNTGLWSYDKNKEEFNQFVFHTSKQSFNSRFSLFASLKSSNGKIWFGTNTGLFVFNPLNISPYPVGPKIYLKTLKINQSPYKTNNHLNELEQLDLNYYENALDLELNALTSYLPKSNIIQYQLEGLNEKWRTIDNGESISIHNIPPGNFKLNIYGINSNGVQGPTKTIKIHIIPPIWQRPWFIILLLVVLIGIIVGVSRIILNYKLRKQKLEFERQQALNEALQNERNRIASEMHDDLGGGLTSIRLILKKIKGTTIPSNAVPYLDRVENYAGELVENMGEIIWAMNSNNDNLIDLITYIRKYTISFFDDHSISCNSNVPKNLPEIAIGGKKRRNIFLCVKECSHNIVKHANAKHVKIHFSWNGFFKIIIDDDGVGINLQQERKDGNGLRNMKKRMEDIGGTIQIISEKGTSIILTIPL